MANVELTFITRADKVTKTREVFDAVGRGAQGMFPAAIANGEINPLTGAPVAYCSSGLIDDQNPVVLGREAVKAALANSAFSEADIDEVFDFLDVTPTEDRQRAKEISEEVERTLAAADYEPGRLYQVGDVAKYNNLTWVNLIPNNSFAPGVAGWRVAWGTTSDTPPPWVQLFGGVGYGYGARVSHNNKNWRSERAVNDREPGTFDSGWVEEDPELELWKQPGTVIPGSSPPAVYPVYDQDYRFSADPNDTQVVEVKHPNAQDSNNVWKFRSKIPANDTEPGTDGTFHRWWEPVEPV
jgi:hypothetical protein